MQSYLAACGLSLAVAALLTRVVRDLSLRYGLLDDVTSSRKIHAVPVPRLGGLGILGGVTVSVLAFGILFGRVGPDGAYGMDVTVFGCGLAMAALGLYDDLRGADARMKFFVQFLVSVAVYLSGLRISQVGNPFGPPIPLGALSFPITLVWIVGVVNSVNLIDGLDGLAGGVTLVAVGTDLVVAGLAGDPATCLVLAALAGAVLGFLIFNFNPASIFMGDSGSMFIGFILAVAPLRIANRSEAAMSLIVPVLGLTLPIGDTLLAIVRRVLAGRPMFSADKEHIHHQVLRRVGGSQRKAVAILYVTCSAFGAAGAALAFLTGVPATAFLAGVAVSALYLFQRFGCLGSTVAMRRLRERNRQLRRLTRETRKTLSVCRNSAEIGASLGRVADGLGCRLEITLEETDGLRQHFAFRPGVPATDAHGVGWECALMTAGTQVGVVNATWFDGRSELDRDQERFLEELLVDLAWALARCRTAVEGQLPVSP